MTEFMFTATSIIRLRTIFSLLTSFYMERWYYTSVCVCARARGGVCVVCVCVCVGAGSQL